MRTISNLKIVYVPYYDSLLADYMRDTYESGFFIHSNPEAERLYSVIPVFRQEHVPDPDKFSPESTVILLPPNMANLKEYITQRGYKEILSYPPCKRSLTASLCRL
jgi:hypothetical protein